MLCPARSHGRALILPLPLRPSVRLSATAATTGFSDPTTTFTGRPRGIVQTRSATSTAKTRSKKHYYEPYNPLDFELQATGVWRAVAERRDVARRRKAKGEPAGAAITGDKSRINITSEALVKDALDYIGSTLERHKGCDLISLYPGAGLWTKALHDRLEPRSHILLEPDVDLYTPFLKPLLEKEGVKLIPKSGIVWKDLDNVLVPENLPHQKEIDRSTKGPIERNDTLLVSVNLAMFPKKRYQLFESLSKLVVYQLVSSMRSSTLFQKYGRVRMLVWIPDDEVSSLLPRTLHNRRRMAIEAELFTEYIGEVCGPDGVFAEEPNGWHEEPDHAGNSKRRWGQLDMESIRLAMVRMRDQGIVTPKGRETRTMRMFLEEGRDLDEPISPTDWLVTKAKKAQKEYDEILAAHQATPFDKNSDEYKRMMMLKNYLVWRDKNELISFEKFVKYHEAREAYIEAFEATSPTARETLLQKAKKQEEEFDRDWDKTPKYLQTLITLGRDQGRMMFHQPPEMGPVLTWDRRPYEPLTVTPQDFYPHVPCALLDIQPKNIPLTLRTMGPGTNNSSGIFDLLLGVLLQRPVSPVVGQLDILWPGANADLAPKLTSMWDPKLGGSPLTGHGALSCRGLNQYQLIQLLEQYVSWPFRPSFADLVGRLSEERFGEEAGTEEDDGVSGAHAAPESL